MVMQGAEAAGDIHRLAGAAEQQAGALAAASSEATEVAGRLAEALAALLPVEDAPGELGRGYARAAAGEAPRGAREAAQRTAAATLIDGPGSRLFEAAPDVRLFGCRRCKCLVQSCVKFLPAFVAQPTARTVGTPAVHMHMAEGYGSGS